MSRVLAFLRSTPVRATFLALAVVAAVWAVVVQRDVVAAALGRVGVGGVLAALAVSVAYVAATALSWRALLADLGSPLPVGVAARVFFVSQVAKYLPGGVWNIVAAAELGADHEVPRRRSVTVMMMSLLVSCVTGAALAVVGLLATAPAIEDFWWSAISALGVVALSLPVLVALLCPPVLGRVVDLALRITKQPPLERRPTWRGVGAGAGWQLVAWLFAGLQVYLLAEPVGLQPGVGGYLLATGGYALAWTAGFLAIVVPAGAGVREVVLGSVLGGTLAPGGAVMVVLLSRVLLTVVDLVAGLGALALGRRRR